MKWPSVYPPIRIGLIGLRLATPMRELMPDISLTKLAGRTVLITGASSGLGLAMARAVLLQGATVIGISRDSAGPHSALSTFARAHQLLDRLVDLACDLTDQASGTMVINDLLKRFGTIDAVVNNAGLGMDAIRRNYLSAPLRFWDVSSKEWDSAMRLNAVVPHMVAALTAPGMVKQGWGRILNVSTTYTSMQRAGFSPYGPSKAALESATLIWSRDLEGTGVTANLILPGGAAATTMTSGDPYFAGKTLLDPAIMGPPLCWLLSREADGVTGHRLVCKNWDPSLPIAAAVARSIAPAGFLTPAV
jgi:NAD(P)-dependent dehydrogenase (short-subunit alcohol dehydrogenase family)